MQDIYIIETGQQPKRDFTFLVTSSRMTNVSAGKISINVTLVITSINRKSNGKKKKKKKRPAVLRGWDALEIQFPTCYYVTRIIYSSGGT